PQRPEWAHWYSLDIAGVHLVMLDSNTYEHQAQLDWLRADLAAARRAGARAIVAAAHHGPASRGPHGGSRLARELYLPVLAEHGVALLLAGHDHIYQRGTIGGVPYAVSGGAGAPLYRITCGGRGRPRCREPDGADIAVSEYHYLVITVRKDDLELCARKPDRTPLERCVRYPLRGG
ncbi:MAG TPA: metallophosphoesterase, partial [Kofleriaceae bacterium]|nr:metallophosphoesterase [Kofleriaceae bacterium]